jgi:acetyl-CoA C-acetyltransferase
MSSTNGDGRTGVREAVILGAVRTPFGKRGGQFSTWHPVEMLSFALKSLIERSGVDPEQVEDVVVGVGLTQGEQAWNLGRIAVLLSKKLPDSVNGSTISRYCASSLNAIRIGADAIKAGDGDLYIAGGATRRGVSGEDVSLQLQVFHPELNCT